MKVRIAFHNNIVLLKAQHDGGRAVETRAANTVGWRRPPCKSNFLGAKTPCKMQPGPNIPMTASMDKERSAAEEYKNFAEMLGKNPSSSIGDGGTDSAVRNEETGSEASGDSKEYADFSELLGFGSDQDKGTGPSPGFEPGTGSNRKSIKNADTASDREKYAEFSEMLGVENEQRRGPVGGGKKKVTPAVRKVEIDPLDYQLFDSLLQKSGGTGKKPMKGSKRYLVKPQTAVDKREGGGDSFDNEGIVSLGDPFDTQAAQSGTSGSSNTLSYLTREETAQAYAIMTEEFGAGMHDTGVETLSDEVIDEEDQDSTTLQTRPTRPGESVGRESSGEVIPNLYSQPVIQKKDTPTAPAMLQKPPSRPSIRTSSVEHMKVVKGSYSEANVIGAEAEAEQFLPEPLLAKPVVPGRSVAPSGNKNSKAKGNVKANVEAKQVISEPLRPKPVIDLEGNSFGVEKRNANSGVDEGKPLEKVLQNKAIFEGEVKGDILKPKPRVEREETKKVVPQRKDVSSGVEGNSMRDVLEGGAVGEALTEREEETRVELQGRPMRMENTKARPRNKVGGDEGLERGYVSAEMVSGEKIGSRPRKQRNRMDEGKVVILKNPMIVFNKIMKEVRTADYS